MAASLRHKGAICMFVTVVMREACTKIMAQFNRSFTAGRSRYGSIFWGVEPFADGLKVVFDCELYLVVAQA